MQGLHVRDDGSVWVIQRVLRTRICNLVSALERPRFPLILIPTRPRCDVMPDGASRTATRGTGGARAQTIAVSRSSWPDVGDVIRVKDRGGAAKGPRRWQGCCASPAGRAGRHETRWGRAARASMTFCLPGVVPARSVTQVTYRRPIQCPGPRPFGRFLPTSDQILPPELIL
jgi:hypothetical protein